MPHPTSPIIESDRWLAIVHELLGLGVREWRFGGGLGEVLCETPLFLKLASMIKASDSRVHLITNGTLFTDELIRRLIELQWDRIDFSVDGATAQTHDHLRSMAGAFARTLAAVSTLRAVGTQGDHHIGLNFATVLTQSNYSEMPAIIRLAHNLGVDHVHFEPVWTLTPFAENNSLTTIDPKLLESIAEAAVETSNTLGMKSNADFILALAHSFKQEQAQPPRAALVKQWLGKTADLVPKIKFRLHRQEQKSWELMSSEDRQRVLFGCPCFEPFLGLVVHRDFEVTPCCTIRRGEQATQQNPVAAIWTGDWFGTLRNQLLQGQIPSCCLHCPSSQKAKTANFKANLEQYLTSAGPR